MEVSTNDDYSARSTSLHPRFTNFRHRPETRRGRPDRPADIQIFAGQTSQHRVKLNKVAANQHLPGSDHPHCSYPFSCHPVPALDPWLRLLHRPKITFKPSEYFAHRRIPVGRCMSAVKHV